MKASIANLTNVGLCAGILERITNRPDHLSGLGVFSGPAGFGKTTAATHLVVRYRGYYVECKKIWSTKAFLSNTCTALGLSDSANKTMHIMLDAICERLGDTDRPLIIDDAQYLVDKRAIDAVNDIHNGCGSAAILLIGEDALATKLPRYERIHSRVIHWERAMAADIDDARCLAELYADGITIADDLLAKIVSREITGGNIRYLVNNIEKIRTEAAATGLNDIDLKTWANRPLFTGRGPIGRR